jgi:energy-coupling factor transporter ATP-binding protein EcfA2
MNTSTFAFTETAQQIADLPYGLVVINGPKGSGKTSLLNLIESIISEGEFTHDCYKLAKGDERSGDGGFRLIDMSESESSDDSHSEMTAAEVTSLLRWQQIFETVMRWGEYRVFAIEDIETTGSLAKYLIEKSTVLALTGTLVIVTIDAKSTPEGENTMRHLQDKTEKFPGMDPLWIDLPKVP